MSCNYLLLYIVGTCFLTVIVGREAIINGNKVNSNLFRYQVSILIDAKIPNCGGGIIHEQFILSAANCVINANGALVSTRITVIAGTNNLHLNGIGIDVLKVIVPKYYKPQNPSIFKDIAVLQLKRPLDLKKNNLIQLVIPRNHRHDYAKETALMTGFGWNWVKTYNSRRFGGNNDSHMRFSEARVLNQTECERDHNHLKITNYHLCARLMQNNPAKPRGVCFGDAGGPLVYQEKYVIGVLSLAKTSCSEEHSSAVYTRVIKYTRFIDNALLLIQSRHMLIIDV